MGFSATGRISGRVVRDRSAGPSRPGLRMKKFFVRFSGVRNLFVTFVKKVTFSKEL